VTDSTTLTGLGVSPGVATGPVARLGLPPRPPADEKPGDDPAVELVRVERATADVAHRLERRAAVATDEAAEVLRATALMAQDPALRSAVEAQLRQGRPTAQAVDAAFEGFADTLASLGGYLAERVADIRDVKNRVLAVLLDVPMPGIPSPGHPFVLVANDLAPADTALLDPTEVLALVTEQGGATSHTAILARTLGLPAVASCPGAMALPDGAPVVVDGSAGLVVVQPDDALLAAVEARVAARAHLRASSHGPGRTADGVPVALLVNVGTAADAERAGTVESEGVGLFRTEFLFLDRQDAPTVEEQVEVYGRVFDSFAGRKVVVRTLDAGADKPLKFVDFGEEENPALGVRGLRVARRHPELLASQLRALAVAAKASGSDVWVMAPMVSTPSEAASFAATCRAHGLATAGVMVEVPAAALRADRVLAEVDFASIGTNDLSQYTYAADRMSGALADLLDPWQPGLLDLVAHVGAAGRRAGRPVGVCGEAAGDPLLALVLVGLGVTSLSMAPGLLPAVRLALSLHTLEQCADIAAVARASASAAEARAAVRSLVPDALLAALD
jgi:phosphotransferase system enzyme I (PtsI)